MVSRYHSNVEKGILAFGKKYKRFVKVCDSTIPIHINRPKKRTRPILYHPDVHFVTKFGKQYVFEILDSELNNENLIMANILLACLTPNVSKVIFIVPKPEDQDKVSDLMLTIVDNLVAKGISNKELPRVMRAVYILRTEAKTPENMTEILVKNAI